VSEYKSTQDFIAMLSSEAIYISALRERMGVWNAQFPQIKVKEWMQEFLDGNLCGEIIRTTLLTCEDVGSEAELKDRLDDLFGKIYQLMVEKGEEISVTDAWVLIRDSVQYGNLPNAPTRVDYSRPIYLEAKKSRDVSTSNKRARQGGEGGSVVGVQAWLQELKCL
jgi:hypothetical protein